MTAACGRGRKLRAVHRLTSVHDQRGWDALIAIGYSIQQPRPRHPGAATEEGRAALKKTPDRGGRGAAQASGRDGRGLGDGRTSHRSQADNARRVGADRRAAKSHSAIIVSSGFM
jgi:hypothetical protein